MPKPGTELRESFDATDSNGVEYEINLWVTTSAAGEEVREELLTDRGEEVVEDRPGEFRIFTGGKWIEAKAS